MSQDKTPKELGYHFPAEFAPHSATWLSWPHKEESWPGKIETIFPIYGQFIKLVAEGEKVNINITDQAMKQKAIVYLDKVGADLKNIEFFIHPTNDAWCRDHGPAFLINEKEKKKMVVKWNYNAWETNTHPSISTTKFQFQLPNITICRLLILGLSWKEDRLSLTGRGTVLTTTACLLNPNRNPHLNQSQIEKYLVNYYGVENVLWLGDGIVGDDTDGHIDDITRFVNEDTVVTVVEENKADENHEPLKENLNALKKMKLENGKSLRIVELPMPDPIIYKDQRLPASYANFYIANNYVVVPTFRDKKDDSALSILQKYFPDRKVVGLDSTDLIWGLGSFHCLSQQEPEIV